MGCGCKNKGKSSEKDGKPTDKTNVVNYIARGIAFLISLVLLPLLVPVMVWMLFKTIVLTDSVNLLPLFTNIGNRLKSVTTNKFHDEDEMNKNDFNPDDYELIGVDKIIKNG